MSKIPIDTGGTLCYSRGMIEQENTDMSGNIETWLVEEVDTTTGRKTFSQVFTDRIEAYETYKYLSESKPDTLVSVTKQTKRLLVE